MWDKLALLTDADAPSGFEKNAADACEKLMRPLVKETRRDKLGSVFGFIPCGAPNAPLLAIDVHIDEVGIIVSGYRDNFAVFRTLGGLDPRVLPAKRIRLLNGNFGVITVMPPHVLEKSQHDKALQIGNELLLDMGNDDVFVTAPVGTPGVFDTNLTYSGDAAFGKALDDRACFAVALRAIELLKTGRQSVDIMLCGVVREETSGSNAGLSGAGAAAFAVNPDLCVSLDVTFAKQPDTPSDITAALGGGPAPGIAPSLDRRLTAKLIETAKRLNIPHDCEVMGGRTGTYADDWAVSRGGVPTALLSLPIRNMHTPVEMLRREDFENCAKLLAAFIGDLGVEDVA